MLIIEFTKTYGDVGQVEVLRIFNPCYGNVGEWTLSSRPTECIK